VHLLERKNFILVETHGKTTIKISYVILDVALQWFNAVRLGAGRSLILGA
jgi:hypothetical protein